MKKKIVSLVLMSTMILSALAGCGQTTEQKESVSSQGSESAVVQESESTVASTEVNEEPEVVEITYPIEEKVKFTIGLPTNANVTAISASHGDTPFFKKLQEETGVELEFVEVASKDMNLLFTGQELPDIIMCYNMGTSYPGGVSAALEDGIIIPITEYLDEYAPDYKVALEAQPELSRIIYAGDELTGFANFAADKYTAVNGMAIRQDWLDELKLPVPTNADELYTVLKAFKEEKGATVPLSTSNATGIGQLLYNGLITSSFGLVNTDFYVKDGKIEAGFIQDEARDVLAYMNKLYNEGLLDPNFSANDNAMMLSNFTTGASGMGVFAISTGLTPVLESMKEDPTFKVTGMAPFKTPDGDISMYSNYSPTVAAAGAFITSACDNVEAAVKFLNYGYTEKGKMLYNFGIEGESYEMVDGVPQYTDAIFANPNMTKSQAAWQYTRVLTNAPKIQMNEYMTAYNPGETQYAALEAWQNSNAADYAVPTLVMYGDEATEHSNIWADLNTYRAEMFVKFINGTESLDNWDAFVNHCKELKVERLLEIKQYFYDEMYK